MNRLIAVLLLIASLSVAPANAQQPGSTAARKPAASPARSITGRVLGEGGQPMAEASVLIVPAGAMSNQNRLAALKSRTANTDEQGRFKLDGLDRGAYSIVAYAPGYVVASGTADDDGQERYFRPGDSVTIRLTKGGVITGTVTSSAGEAMIGVRVQAIPVRGPDGRTLKVTGFNPLKEWKTDDRGVYRIYGLDPGAYVVSAGGKGFGPFWTGPYDNDAPTFFPSGTRDTAKEVMVQSGDEARGIDIRYRDNQGHIISGTVASSSGLATNGFVVTLNQAATGVVVAWTFTMMEGSSGSFAMDGVPDGEYDVTAISDTQSDHIMASYPRRVTVRGADVTGIELVTKPLASIAGRVTLERAPAAPSRFTCENKRPAAVEETVLAARPDEKGKSGNTPLQRLPFNVFAINADSVPDDKGEFSIRPLDDGRYRIAVQLPTIDWFIRSITLPAPGPGQQPKDAAREGVGLKSGERLTGVTITLAEGAAGLRGRVVAAKAGDELPQRIRVHLVPAEREHADNVLRYGEAGAQHDGNFTLNNLAPGRYWIVATQSADEQVDEAVRPLAWDAEGRARLRREGEALNAIIELQQCERVVDYVLKYAPAPKAK